MNWLAEMQILAIIAHFWPVFDLLRLWYQCLDLSMNVFVLVMTRWSELSKTILSADFGNFNPFLAGFWPVMALVSKALNENISFHHDWIEFEQQQKIE